MKKRFVKKVMATVLTVATVLGLVGIMNYNVADAAWVQGAGINVEKIDGISDDFIMGMDVSSYVSVTKSGVVFKDFDGNALDDAGFFNLLKFSGVNYIRIRVWNDPYDANGNGYGGGNCDLENAAIIGKLATNAGMKVLVDFHYSDFWADPSRQLVPKAWKGYSVSEKETAIYDYTKESLTYLKNQGVNIGMVQVGNETTGGICGESDWGKNGSSICKLINSGCRAIREIDKNILIAIHFTDPNSKDYNWYASVLKNNNVDYDVFASSYYPSWHGTMNNLSNKLKTVSNNYSKKVMVVETAYPHTTEDYDQSGNDTLNYQISGFPEVSVQGQADYMAQLIKAVVGIGDNAIGVCYWEGAWTAVGNNKSSNMVLWEKYGSGWTTKYADEYDSAHVCGKTGGPSTDNQCFFDGNGKALASLNIFTYVKTGATTDAGQINTTEASQATQMTKDTEATQLSSENTTTSSTTVGEEQTTKQAEDETTTVEKETETTEDETKKNEKDEETTLETEKTNENASDKLNTNMNVKDENKKEANPVLTVVIVAEVLALIAAIAVLAVIIIKKKRR